MHPLTGSVATQTSLSDGLSTIAVSSDGSLLYAGSTTSPSVGSLAYQQGNLYDQAGYVRDPLRHVHRDADEFLHA